MVGTLLYPVRAVISFTAHLVITHHQYHLDLLLPDKEVAIQITSHHLARATILRQDQRVQVLISTDHPAHRPLLARPIQVRGVLVPVLEDPLDLIRKDTPDFLVVPTLHSATGGLVRVRTLSDIPDTVQLCPV